MLIVLNLKPLKLKDQQHIATILFENKHMHQDLGVRVLVAGQYLVLIKVKHAQSLTLWGGDFQKLDKKGGVRTAGDS